MTRSRDLANLADSTEFTSALNTKLTNIETSATADQTNAEIRAAVEAATDSNVFTDADHSKLNAVEASADVTDTANVTSAGALMDSELTNLAAVKAINQSLVTTASPTFAGMGIGTSSPNSYSGYGAMTINGTTGSLLDFEVNGTLTGELYADSGITGLGIGLQAVGSRIIHFKTNNQERMRIDSSGVDVTGTVTADGLTVDSTTNSPVIIKSTHSTGGYAELQLGANGATIGYLGSGETLVSGANTDLTLRSQANLLFGSGGGSERMRLSNLGQVNIRKGAEAIVTPLQYDGLVIQNDDATGIRIISDEGKVNEGHAGIGVDNGELTISAKGQISFDTGFLPSDQLYVGKTERFRISTDGNVTVKTGNLVIGTSGKGIDFSAYGSGTNVE